MNIIISGYPRSHGYFLTSIEDELARNVKHIMHNIFHVLLEIEFSTILETNPLDLGLLSRLQNINLCFSKTWNCIFSP